MIGINEGAAMDTAAGSFVTANNLIKSNATCQLLQEVQLNLPSPIDVMAGDKDSRLVEVLWLL